MNRVLHEIVDSRYRWRHENLAEEAAKGLMYAVPLVLFLGGIIDNVALAAFIAGVFSWRGYGKFIIPEIGRILSPPDPPSLNDPWDGRVLFDEAGITVTNSAMQTMLPWRSVTETRHFERGLLIRIVYDHAFAAPYERLPEGVTGQNFAASVERWRSATE